MNALARAGFALTLVTFAVSATSATQSLDARTFGHLEQAPRRVFLRVHYGSLMPQAFQDGYVNALHSEFMTLGATVHLVKLTGLELERTAYLDEQRAFEPDLILVVQFDATGGMGPTYRGEASLSLRDRAETELWRAQQRFSFNTMNTRKGVSDSGGKAGAELMQRLLADRVLAN